MYTVIHESVNSFINNCSKEKQNLCFFVIKKTLAKIPHNPDNDKDFSILSTNDKNAPIMCYKKGDLIFIYRLDKIKNIVHLNEIKMN